MAQQSRFAPNFGITASLSCSTLLVVIILIMIHTFSFLISFPNALISGTIQLAGPEISLDIWMSNRSCSTPWISITQRKSEPLTTNGHGFVNLPFDIHAEKKLLEPFQNAHNKKINSFSDFWYSKPSIFIHFLGNISKPLVLYTRFTRNPSIPNRLKAPQGTINSEKLCGEDERPQECHAANISKFT